MHTGSAPPPPSGAPLGGHGTCRLPAAASRAPVRPSAAPRPYLTSWAVFLAAAVGVKWRRDLVTGGPGGGTPMPSGRVMAWIAPLTPSGGRERGDGPLPAP